MAITVDSVFHDSDASTLVSTEGSDAGTLAKDISGFLADGDTIISISHCYLPTRGKVLTTIIKDSD